jgi:hypothetical protein
MSKLTTIAALIAATAYASEALAAHSNVTPKQTGHVATTACERAPDVGAFASAPYTSPPCTPGKAN